MKKKTIGIALVVVGIIIMSYSKLSFSPNKEVARMSIIEIKGTGNHLLQWPPVLGAILFLGGVVIIVSHKKDIVQ